MKILDFIRALRKGASLPNPTRVKWAGIAATGVIIGLSVAHQYGYLMGVSEDAAIQLVFALLALYASLAADPDIGVGTAPRRLPEPLPGESERDTRGYVSHDHGPLDP